MADNNRQFVATIDIANDPASYKPVMTNNFVVSIFGLDGIRDWTSDDPNAVIKDSMLSLKIANDSFQEPTLTQQVVDIKKGNIAMAFPGSIQTMTSTSDFQVYVNKSSYNALYSWKMLSGNQETGEVGNPNEYWKKVVVDITSGNKGTIYGTWTFPFAWISSLSGTTFSNSGNEIRKCSITLQYFQPKYRATSATGNN